MKIKHWQGYGCVEAKKIYNKIFKSSYGDTSITLHILVIGNHEWGIETTDKYCLFNWLVKRFSRLTKSYYEIVSVETYDYYKSINGIDTEHCLYKFRIHIKC